MQVIHFNAQNNNPINSSADSEKFDAVKIFFQNNSHLELEEILKRLAAPTPKKSFLVFKNNRYISIPTERIAFFQTKNGNTVIVCFDQQEYIVDQSLNQVEKLLYGEMFFRLNRQCLINFNSIKEVEHYFARKLTVKLVIPEGERVLVSKEKARFFLRWLDTR